MAIVVYELHTLPRIISLCNIVKMVKYYIWNFLQSITELCYDQKVV